MKIGVLSLQGDYENHLNKLKELEVDSKKVRYADDLDLVDALIIPGGESTAIFNLIEKQGLYKKINNFIASKPVYGSCAGLILLSSIIMNNNQSNKKIKSFKIFDTEIERNGWGRQIQSFIKEIKIKSFKENYKAIFIRAPKIISIKKNIEVLSEFSNTPVMIKKGHALGTTFHPELTDDLRIHQYFLDMVREHRVSC